MTIFVYFKSAQGTKEALKTMDFFDKAVPYVFVPAKSSINPQTLDFFDKALPFNPYARG